MQPRIDQWVSVRELLESELGLVVWSKTSGPCCGLKALAICTQPLLSSPLPESTPCQSPPVAAAPAALSGRLGAPGEQQWLVIHTVRGFSAVREAK